MSIQEMEDLKQQYLDEMKCLINSEYRDEIKIDELKGSFNSMSIEINKKKKLQDLEQVANLSTYPLKRFNSFYYDDDDDEDYTVVITPDFLITNSLIMENEHLDTIPETESDEFIKSSVENLVQIPSETEDFSDIENKCDMLDCDDSQTTNFSTFSNPLFNDSNSSDDESSHEEVIHKMSFKTYSNPFFDLDEEIISSEFNPIHNEDLDSTLKNDRFDTKSYLLEPLVNRDTLMASSPKFDSLLKEFSGELAHTDLIPPGINEAFYDDHVKEISSGSTTTHSDYSLYDSFIFDLSINTFPAADRSDFYEFADELTHIISPPEYDSFFFKIEPNSGDFTMDVYSRKCKDSCERILSSSLHFLSFILGIMGPHENFQCQPMNQNFYEPNMCSNSISFDFDQFQPPQFPVIHQPPQEMKDYTVVISPEFPITDSLIMENEHLDTIPETESEKFIKSSVENLVPIPSESEDFLISKVNVICPIFDSLLEEFSGELAHTDLIPPGINEAFYDDHVKEISSGSTTAHFDSSLYDSFIFDLSINPFPPADRSNFYEFADELTHIISPPKYDCVCFKIEPNLGEFTMDVVEDTFPTRE
nr:hypothetical protein [Tanacetum cinerariifolium]